MRVIPAVLFVFLLAFLIQGGAQDLGTSGLPVEPQILLPPSAGAAGSSDPNDSGYTSLYLQQHDWTSEDDADDAMLRTEANLERRSGNPSFAGDMMDQAQQQRALFPRLFDPDHRYSGIPTWF